MSYPAAQQQHSQALRPRLSSLSTLPSFSTYPASLEDAESSSEAWVLFSPSNASREPADYDDAYTYSLTSDERHALQEEQEDYEEEEEEEDEETDVEDVHEADVTISSSLLEPFTQGQAASLFVAPAHDGAGIFDESISERIESWRMETARLFLSEMGCFDEDERERILQAASGKTTRQVSRAPTIHNDGGDYDGYSSTESEEDPLPWWQMVLHEILHGLDGMFHDIYQAALHIPPRSQHLLESSSDLSSLAAASEAVAEASTSTLSLPSLAASSDASGQQERQASTPTFLPTLPPQTAPPAAAQEDVRFWEQSIGLNTIPSIFSILKRRFNGPMEHGLEGLGMKSRVSCASGSGWGSEVGGSSGIW
jgi:hypothetical protein